MKIKVSGDTPLERLTNFTREILAVPKSEIIAKKRAKRKKAKRNK